MTYTAEISRVNPACFLIVIDQSGSMSDSFGASDGGGSKADELASAINRLLYNMVIKCSKDNEVVRYFQVGVIGYGATVEPSLGGNLAGRELVWIDDIYNNPERVEERLRKQSDGAGGLIEVNTKFPIWLDAKAGNGTPMCAALADAYRVVSEWAEQHPTSFPPIVIHITDGESTDGDPMPLAEAINALATQDGNVLLLNLHLSSHRAAPVHFPSGVDRLPDPYARKLFEMSSILPDHMCREAQNSGYQVSESARGFVFNAGIEDVISFLDIGTRASNLR